MKKSRSERQQWVKDVRNVLIEDSDLTEQQLDAMDQMEAIHAYQARKCKCHGAGIWQKIIDVKSTLARAKEKMFKICK